ncbi:MAG: 4-amino-4-deoxychorismate lyase [Gallionellaceae bacterium]|nr:MAG: 4-amino-4-deoxychorismate lyase [Gallionellaceae bacterium]
MLVNGELDDSISAADRGLLYGDGVFRTLRVTGGQPLHWQRHYRKLQQDCAALALPCPDASLLLEELHRLIASGTDGVAKIIVTRGAGVRGYAPPGNPIPTRILALTPCPPYPGESYTQGVKLRICDLRLSHQPRLAGVKHLNRLENVLAAAEWDDPGIAEGLLLDMGDNVIEGTRSNLFMVSGGALLTPDLSRCGVAGVQRERVLEWAAAHGAPCRIAQFGPGELRAADEIFLVNSIIGLWPVRELLDRSWSYFPFAMQVQEWLSHAPD